MEEEKKKNEPQKEKPPVDANEKRIKDLRKKLNEINKLKERRDRGDKLEVWLVSSEADNGILFSRSTNCGRSMRRMTTPKSWGG